MLKLKQNKIHHWHTDAKQQVWVKGFAYLKGQLLEGQQLIDLFSNVQSKESFCQQVQSLDGRFAVVLWQVDFKAAAVDAVNAFPLYFKYLNNSNKELQICDSILSFSNKINKKSVSYQTFIAGGFTLNNDTLLTDWSKLQSGQILWSNNESDKQSDNQKPNLTYWNQHFSNNSFTKTKPTLSKIEHIADKVFNRALKRTKNKTIIIPLSGGLDSRFILAKCHQMGVKNLFCFTYGRKDSFEYEIAKKVSQQLNIEWHFIEFNEQIFDYYFNERFEKYQTVNFNAAVLPLEQDWLALYHLKQQKLLPENGIVFSGFGADVLAGSWIPKKVQWEHIKSYNNDSLAKYIVNQGKFFNQEYIKDSKEELREAVLLYLKRFIIKTQEDWLSALHNWGLEHRLSRYHVNGVRIFEDLGLDWHLPFFDSIYIDYWANLPWKEKIDKKHYKAYLEEHLFGPLEINYYNNSSLHNRPHNSWLTRLKLKTPKKLKETLKPFIAQKSKIDVLNFDLLSEMIYKRLTEENQKLLKNHKSDLNLLESVYLLQMLDV